VCAHLGQLSPGSAYDRGRFGIELQHVMKVAALEYVGIPYQLRKVPGANSKVQYSREAAHEVEEAHVHEKLARSINVGIGDLGDVALGGKGRQRYLAELL